MNTHDSANSLTVSSLIVILVLLSGASRPARADGGIFVVEEE